jgi:hypothetical protein
MTVCPGFEVNLPGPGAMNITIIACIKTNPTDMVCNCSNSPPEGHCNVTCNPPYFPVFGNITCGFCPAGTVLQGACGAGECETLGGCGPGQCLGG